MLPWPLAGFPRKADDHVTIIVSRECEKGRTFSGRRLQPRRPPTGQRLARPHNEAVGHWDGTDEALARLWSTSVRRGLLPRQPYLACGVAVDNAVQVWDVAAQRIRTLRAHIGLVFCVAYSSDGSRLASGSRDTTVK